MTFIEKTKRFFEPLYAMPWHFFWNTSHGIIYSIYFIFSFEVLRAILVAISNSDALEFHRLIIIYTSWSLIFIISRFALYKT
jgi:hypothetical protein